MTWPLGLTVSQFNSIHNLTRIFFRTVLILSSHLRLGSPRGHFSPEIPNKILYELIISHMRATCHSHPILLYFTVLIFVEE
jgi:hypothetical protein